MRVSLFFLFSCLVTISKPPSLQAAPMEHRVTAKRGLHPSTPPLSQSPRQTNPASHTSTTRTPSHTLTHALATHRNTKSLCHAPSTGGSNVFWRLLLLCSNHPAVHIHRKEGAGEESKKQEEEEESLVCGREQRRRKGKGPNLWHFQNGAGASDGQQAGSLPPRGPSA